MTGLDIKQAKQALTWRLADWGIPDAPAKAAAFIDDLVSRGWQMSPDREARPKPPRREDACQSCGRRLHPVDAVCDQPTARPVPHATDATPRVRALRALVAPPTPPKIPAAPPAPTEPPDDEPTDVPA